MRGYRMASGYIRTESRGDLGEVVTKDGLGMW